MFQTMNPKLNVRSDFPILMKYPDLVYLDSTSTSLVPRVAVEATERFMKHTLVSSRRGAYGLAVDGSRMVDDVRKSLAGTLNTNDFQLSFQKSIASACASFAYGYDWKSSGKNKVVVAQSEEHNIFVSLLRVCQILDLEFEMIPVDNSGVLNLDELTNAIDDRTGIVAVSHVTTGLGIVNPLHEVSEVTREHNALLLTDASRSIGFTEFDITTIPADIILFSANIGLLAPPGLALQWQAINILDDFLPGILGGSVVTEVGRESFQISRIPHRFEPDILNLPAIAGFGSSIQYLERIGVDNVVESNRELSTRVSRELSENENITLYGENHNQRTIFGFNIFDGDELNCHDAALLLDQAGIAVRTGFLCAHPSIQRIAPNGLIQISIHFYNTVEDIDYVGETLSSISRML